MNNNYFHILLDLKESELQKDILEIVYSGTVTDLVNAGSALLCCEALGMVPDSQDVAIKHTNLDKTLNSKETNATVKDDQAKTEILES